MPDLSETSRRDTDLLAQHASSFLYNAVSGSGDALSLYGTGVALANDLGYPHLPAIGSGDISSEQILASGPHAGDTYLPGVQEYDRLDHIRGFARTIAAAPRLRVQEKVFVLEQALNTACSVTFDRDQYISLKPSQETLSVFKAQRVARRELRHSTGREVPVAGSHLAVYNVGVAVTKAWRNW